MDLAPAIATTWRGWSGDIDSNIEREESRAWLAGWGHALVEYQYTTKGHLCQRWPWDFMGFSGR